MEIMLRPPTKEEQKDWQGSSELRYTGRVDDGIPLDRSADEWYQYLTVTVDAAGVLAYEYYRSELSNHYDEPPGDNVILFFKDFGNVESAKRMHDIFMTDIENYTPARWTEAGFTMEDIS